MIKANHNSLSLFTIKAMILFFVSLLIMPNSCYVIDHTGQNEDSFTFKQIQFSDSHDLIVHADFDGDGYTEFATNANGKGPTISDFDKERPNITCHILGKYNILKFFADDFLGDPAAELILQVFKDSQTWIEIWGSEQTYGGFGCKFLWKSDPIILHDHNYDGEIDKFPISIKICDVNDDATNDVIAAYGAGYDLQPRCVIAYDGVTGSQLWNFPIAGHPHQPNCGDIDGDGQVEIIFGTRAPANGYQSGDMIDSKSYLVCLEQNGQLLWKYETGGAFSQSLMEILDIDHDGADEVISTYCNGDYASKTTTFQLQIRDGKTGSVKKFHEFPTDIRTLLLADLDHDSHEEIITLTENGCLTIFNSSLDVLKNVRLFIPSQFSVSIKKCVDIDQDGLLEFIVIANNKLFILNHDLKKIAHYESNLSIGAVDYFKHPLYSGVLSVCQGRIHSIHNIVFLQVIPISKLDEIVDVARQKYAPLIIALSFMLGMILAGIVFTIAPQWIRKIRENKELIRKKQRDELFEDLSVFNHGQTADKNLSRLSFYFINVSQQDVPPDDYQKRLRKVIRTYQVYTAEKIAEIIQLTKKVYLTIDITDLEQTFRLLNVQMSRVAEYRNDIAEHLNFIKNIPLTIDDLSQQIKKLTTFLYHMCSTDVVALVQQALVVTSPDFMAEGVELKCLHVEGVADPHGVIHANEGVTIFVELTRNAIRSMQKVQKKQVSLYISANEKKVFIDITDTGCGISHELHESIFNREFTTKEEGGAGLYHARKTLNKYHGKIYIKASAPGAGTTMRIELMRGD